MGFAPSPMPCFIECQGGVQYCPLVLRQWCSHGSVSEAMVSIFNLQFHRSRAHAWVHMLEVSAAVCLSIASPEYPLMLLIKDLLNPLPIAYHMTKLASLTSMLANCHITPNGSTTNNMDHEGGSPTAQSSHRSQSSLPASCSHGTPHCAQLGDPSVSPCWSPSLPPNLHHTI